MLKHLLRRVLRLVARILFRVRVEGRFEAPAGGRLLVIANHESFLDG